MGNRAWLERRGRSRRLEPGRCRGPEVQELWHRRMFSRKKAAQRAKRMAGQGLEAFPKALPAAVASTALTAATRDRVDRSW